MKKQDTAAFSLIRCDTEKKMPALAVRAIRAALFFAGLLAVAQGAAGIWTNYGWLWAALPDLRGSLLRALPRGSHYGQQLRGRDADEGHGTYPPAAGRSGSGCGTFCGYFGGTARHALCLCRPLVADRLRSAADGAVCGASGAAQAGFSAGLDGGVPALRSSAAGRRRGRPQRIRSNAFELWRAAGSGRRACSCTAGRTGPAKRRTVFRVGRGLSRGAA